MQEIIVGSVVTLAGEKHQMTVIKLEFDGDDSAKCAWTDPMGKPYQINYPIKSLVMVEKSGPK